jgi:hypothetical protein
MWSTMLRRKKWRIRMTLPPETIQAMLAAEVSACKAVLAEGVNRIKTQMRIPLVDFVTRSFLLHRRLIERWGGWRYRGEPFLVQDTLLATKIAQTEWDSFSREVGNLVRDGKIPQYAGRVYCQSYNTDYTFGPALLLSQKNLSSEYYYSTGVNGQEHIRLPTGTMKLVLGTHRPRSANGYDESLFCDIRVGQRVSAAVMRALEENDVQKPLIAAWDKLFQRLGEVAWTGQSVPIQVSLSCAPSSFLRLGQYGENSCYRHGGEGEYSKFWLAADCPDSFVALFHRLKDGPQKDTEAKDSVQVAGRAWGIACIKRGALLSNFYQLPREMVLPAVVEALSAGLGVEHAEAELQLPDAKTGMIVPWYDLLMRTGAVYMNKDVHLVHNTKSAVKLRTLTAYLRAIMGIAGTYGFYRAKGAGPTLLRTSPTSYKVVGGPPQLRQKALWPYKDFILPEVVERAIIEQGMFIPALA